MAEANTFFPRDWDDDDRMNFMFSAFNESREVNPKHWDSKLHYWSSAILESCKHHGDVCIDLATLKRRFARNAIVPLGLATVVMEMLREGKFERKDEFLSCENKGWLAWSYGLAKESFWWGVGAFRGKFSKVPTNLNENEQFVLVGEAREKGEWILRRHHECVECEITDHVIPWNVLKSRYKEFDEETLTVVLASLQRQGKAVLFFTIEGEKIVKFAKKTELKVTPVSENDVDIVRLRKTVARMTIQVRKLSDEVESCRLQAARFAKEGSKSKALQMLKRRDARRKTLDKLSANLTSLEEIVHRIQHANTNIMVFDALKSGMATLKSLHGEMDIDTVEDTIDELNETLSVSQDIDNAISKGIPYANESSDIGYDELEELEKELESLTVSEKGRVPGGHPTSLSPLLPKVVHSTSPTCDQKPKSPLAKLSVTGQEPSMDRETIYWPGVPTHDPDVKEPKKKTVLLSN